MSSGSVGSTGPVKDVPLRRETETVDLKNWAKSKLNDRNT